MTQHALHLIVPAAGTGTRMQADKLKQYLSLLGKTILSQTLQALHHLPYASLSLVINPDDEHLITSQAEWPDDYRIQLVAGGAERMHSVYNALKVLNARPHDWVAVHDAARPCLLIEDVIRLLSTLESQSGPGGLLGTPISSTLKIVQEGYVQQTQDRTHLWQALTPQIFQYAVLLQAYETLFSQQIPVTDDASVMELAGYQPLIMAGDARNIKITQPQDLLLAEQFLPAIQQANQAFYKESA